MCAASNVHVQLDLACRIAEALIESSSVAALNLVEELEPPTAVFEVGNPTPRLANAAWRALCGAADPFGANVDRAAECGASIHIAELALDVGGRPVYCAATLRPSHDALGATKHVIAACADITDEVIARQLAVDPTALVWSGSLGRDPDYFNRRYAAERLSSYD